MTQPTQKSFVQREPVVVSTVVAWLFSLLGTDLLGHTSLINGDTWSGLTTTLVPVVSALVLAALGYLTRKFVAPAWKLVLEEGKRFGLSEHKVAELVEQGVVTELKNLQHDNPNLAPVIGQILASKEAG